MRFCHIISICSVLIIFVQTLLYPHSLSKQPPQIYGTSYEDHFQVQGDGVSERPYSSTSHSTADKVERPFAFNNSLKVSPLPKKSISNAVVESKKNKKPRRHLRYVTPLHPRGLDGLATKLPASDGKEKYVSADGELVTVIGREGVQTCEDSIKNYQGAKFNMQHTMSHVLFSYCSGCISNTFDGDNAAVGKDSYPSTYWFDMYDIKLVGEHRVRISVGNVGNLGIGTEKEEENLIIFGNNDQEWNYSQNPDCSYTIFTDDNKVLKLAHNDNFKVRTISWKAEVASKGRNGDCNFNIQAVETVDD